MTRMKLTVDTFELRLRHTFTIARGSEDATLIVIARVERDGIEGIGETSPAPFYGHTAESVKANLESLAPWLATQDPMQYRLLLREAGERMKGDTHALCALDLAVHDWVGKRLGVPLYKLFGLRATDLPPTTYTIGIDAIPKMIEKMREFAGFPIYKIKLGTRMSEGRDRDLEIVRALRAETDATFRVDANCAWSPEETIEKSKELAALGVEYIEQPMPRERLDAMAEVYAKSALPLVADENSIAPADVPGLAGRFHGINIKLVKCGGLAPALEMIAIARALGMKIMIGCMVESSNACTAAAHLGSLVDYLDLDGPLLVANDPFEGIKIERGRIELPRRPGHGAEFKAKPD
jgi:L-alanine-DL-glutamate epimerase-like enolase superfamily enzyme